MKSIKRFALLAATVIAVAGFATSSDAAKKAACSAMAECSTQCKAGVCKLMTCSTDGKWVATVLPRVCKTPDCPQKC